MNYELKNRLVVSEKAVSLHRLKKKDTHSGEMAE